MPRTPAQARAYAKKVRDQVLAVVNAPCITVDFSIDYGDNPPAAGEERERPPPRLADGSGRLRPSGHRCGPNCIVVDLSMDLSGSGPCACGSCMECLHREGKCVATSCTLCVHAEFVERSARDREPSAVQLPVSASEPMPVPARDVVATMRPEAKPRPALPAPAALYGLEAAYAPECVCGHPASGHEEFRLASTCLDCGRAAREHKDDGVLRFGGPGPCQFKPHFAGCALVFTPGGPCRCKAYAPKETQCP